MPDATDLYHEWTGGESSGVHPRRVQRLRNDLIEATGLEPPRQRVAIEEWLDRYKGEVTKRLAEAADVDSEGEAEAEDEAESGE